MAGLASRLLDAALEDGGMRGPLGGMFPVHLPVPSFADALAPLSDKLPKVDPNKGQLAKMAWKKAGSIPAQFPTLTRDECAAIVLYTMEDMPRERSPYYVMNAALREKNRQAVRPWRDFVWLLLHALRKLPPSKARIVYRGMAGSVLAEGAELQWSAFSSTATKVDVMQVFLDTEEAISASGPRTMIHLELTEPVGRDVSAFSLYPQECEVLLPPNICFEVVSRYNAGSGLVMVQCKQTESLDALLDFGTAEGVPADSEEELQAKMARLQVAKEKAVKEAQRERDVSRLIELGAETRERAIALLERHGSLQAAANALCAAADASIPSEVRKRVEQLRIGGVARLATKAEFDKALADEGDKLVVVDFTASWCGPCQRIAPVFAKLAEEMPDVVFVKVDVDENEEVASDCGISAMPTFQFYKSGAKVHEFSGASEGKIKEAIAKHK